LNNIKSGFYSVARRDSPPYTYMRAAGMSGLGVAGLEFGPYLLIFLEKIASMFVRWRS